MITFGIDFFRLLEYFFAGILLTDFSYSILNIKSYSQKKRQKTFYPCENPKKDTNQNNPNKGINPSGISGADHHHTFELALSNGAEACHIYVDIS